MEFSRPEYWNGLLFLPPGDLPDPGLKPGSPALLSSQGNKMCPKVIVSSLYTIYAYKSFCVNFLLLDSGAHLYLYYTEMLLAAFA